MQEASIRNDSCLNDFSVPQFKVTSASKPFFLPMDFPRIHKKASKNYDESP